MMIVVVANSEEKQRTIAALIEAEGQSVTALSNLDQLPELLKKIPVNGILLELVTSTKADKTTKESTNGLIQLYPNAIIKVVGQEILIPGGGTSLQQFVQQCSLFKARIIRKSARRIRHIAFLLSADNKFKTAEKVVTLNIADDGCFIYSTSDWHVGDRVWLRFVDNDKVMTAVVCWWQPWGNNKKMPGIGVKFD